MATAKPATAEAAPERRGRGRPRPQDVIDRDELVFAKLTKPRTKQDIAEELGLGPAIVYLSLWRLRRQERIRRQVTEAGNTTLWERVS